MTCQGSWSSQQGSRLLRVLTAAAAWLACALPAFAAYPERPVQLVIPYAVGGPTDQLARMFAHRLGEQLGQSVVPENRPGAGSIVAVRSVIQNGASGYTVLFAGPGALVLNPKLNKNASYDPDRDLSAVGLVSNMPLVMVVNPASPAETVGEFVALERSNPGELDYGSPGIGTPLHLAAEMFNMMSGTRLQNIPFNGTAPALISLMAGDIDVVFDVVSSAKPFIDAGRLRALGVTTQRRSPVLPAVPTLAESGFKGYDASSWFALTTAGSAPDTVKQRLNEATRAVMTDPLFRAELERLGLIPYEPMSQTEIQRFIEDEKTRWGKVIETNGISLN
jgi:tripartite-type tricarboxylate transporter receptor subunit TctC